MPLREQRCFLEIVRLCCDGYKLSFENLYNLARICRGYQLFAMGYGQQFATYLAR